MESLKFLEPEIADKIEKITSNLKDLDPIDKLGMLKFIFKNNMTVVYNKDDDDFKNIYDKHYDKIKKIINEHPEQLLLHFATYDPQNKSHAAFVTPISNDFDCITYIRKNRTPDPTPVASAIAVASVLKRKDSDIEFDLTLVDTYDLDNENPYPPGVKSYVYGDPYNEDWTHVEKTNFSNIDDVIKNNQ